MGQRSQHGGGAQLTDGAWQALCADRTQAKLDDAIKGYHADFSMATKKLTVDESWGVIRLGVRMTHVIDETLFPGMAKYPVDKQENAGQPYLSAKSWVNLVLKQMQDPFGKIAQRVRASREVGGQTPAASNPV